MSRLVRPRSVAICHIDTLATESDTIRETNATESINSIQGSETIKTKTSWSSSQDAGQLTTNASSMRFSGADKCDETVKSNFESSGVKICPDTEPVILNSPYGDFQENANVTVTFSQEIYPETVPAVLNSGGDCKHIVNATMNFSQDKCPETLQITQKSSGINSPKALNSDLNFSEHDCAEAAQETLNTHEDDNREYRTEARPIRPIIKKTKWDGPTIYMIQPRPLVDAYDLSDGVTLFRYSAAPFDHPSMLSPKSLAKDRNQSRYVIPKSHVSSEFIKKTKIGFDPAQCIFIKIGGIILNMSGDFQKAAKTLQTYELLYPPPPSDNAIRPTSRSRISISYQLLETEKEAMPPPAQPNLKRRNSVAATLVKFMNMKDDEDEAPKNRKTSLEQDVSHLDLLVKSGSMIEAPRPESAHDSHERKSTDKEKTSLWDDLKATGSFKMKQRRQSLFEMIVDTQHQKPKGKDVMAKRKSAVSCRKADVDSFVSQLLAEQPQDREMDLRNADETISRQVSQLETIYVPKSELPKSTKDSVKKIAKTEPTSQEPTKSQPGQPLTKPRKGGAGLLSSLKNIGLRSKTQNTTAATRVGTTSGKQSKEESVISTPGSKTKVAKKKFVKWSDQESPHLPLAKTSDLSGKLPDSRASKNNNYICTPDVSDTDVRVLQYELWKARQEIESLRQINRYLKRERENLEIAYFTTQHCWTPDIFLSLGEYSRTLCPTLCLITAIFLGITLGKYCF